VSEVDRLERGGAGEELIRKDSLKTIEDERKLPQIWRQCTLTSDYAPIFSMLPIGQAAYLVVVKDKVCTVFGHLCRHL